MTQPSLSPSPTVLFKEMDEGAVLFCSRTEVYFGLNPVGVLIWKALLAGDRTEAAVVESLAAAYPEVDRATLAHDVGEFLQALETDELVRRETESAAGGS